MFCGPLTKGTSSFWKPQCQYAGSLQKAGCSVAVLRLAPQDFADCFEVRFRGPIGMFSAFRFNAESSKQQEGNSPSQGGGIPDFRITIASTSPAARARRCRNWVSSYSKALAGNSHM